MWVPRSIEDIERAIARGDLEETSSFDAKQELPSSSTRGNASVAVDVAAMSTAGGSILYGLGEDTNERLTIVQTSIAEVPYIEFRSYPLPDDATTGYLLVIVPPSPRAPHQVTVGDDRRFYGRGARGNRRLTEQEVALLYSRRQQSDVNREARLEQVVHSVPYVPESEDDGCVYAFAQPVPLDQGLWDAAEAGAGGLQALQQQLERAARSVTTEVEFDPSFRDRVYWRRLGADAWRMSSQPEDPPRPELVRYLAEVTFNIDGRAVLFSGNATQRIHENASDTRGRKYLFERTIAGSLAGYLAVMGVLFERAAYFGAVDLGVAVTNLYGAVSVGRHERTTGLVMWAHVPTYAAQSFTRTRRLSTASELHDAQGVALSLVGRLFSATTGRVSRPVEN